MEEGIVQNYLLQLSREQDAGKLLTSFYLDLYRLPSSQFGMFISEISRLVNLYGRYTVFYAMLDTLDIPDVAQEGVGRLLSYFCKKRLTVTEPANVSLDDYVDKAQKKIDKIKSRKTELKIRSPLDE